MPKNLITHKRSFSTLGAEVRFWRVVLAGLGTMVGAGIFVGVGIAAGIADRYIVLALMLVAFLALCTGLNSIQLTLYHARSFKRSAGDGDADGDADGTVYGYSRGLLNTWLGFVAALSLAFSQAGTAAAAALGVAGYALNVFGVDPIWLAPIAVVITVTLAGSRLVGLDPARWSAQSLTLGMTVAGLVALVMFSTIGGLQALILESSSSGLPPDVAPALPPSTMAISSGLRAASLMVVAYGGYERIVAFVNFSSIRLPYPGMSNLVQTDPELDPTDLVAVKFGSSRYSLNTLDNVDLHNVNVHKLSKAMIVTIALATVLYSSVAIVAIHTIGSTVLSDSVGAFVAPLGVASRSLKLLGSPVIMTGIMALGAILTLLGITGYLLARLARVLWKMGQRRDLPRLLARVDATTAVPNLAWIVATGMIACIALTSDIEAIWSFSAFALLLHMAITNLAALRLSPGDRLYPRWITWVGLGLSVFLIPWLEWRIWLMGLGLVVISLIWRGINLWSAEQAGG